MTERSPEDQKRWDGYLRELAAMMREAGVTLEFKNLKTLTDPRARCKYCARFVRQTFNCCRACAKKRFGEP